MTMVIALGLAMALFLLSVGLHLASLGVGHRWLARRNDFAVKLAISLLVFLSHLLVVALFATGFGLGVEWGLGTFAGTQSLGWMDHFYFSLVTMTTLGLGDIYPTGHLRIIAGVEALAGFVLISCSAQIFWSMMHEQHSQDG